MLVYRLLEERDLTTRVNFMNDPRVYRTMHYSLPITIEGTEQWYQNVKLDSHRFDAVLEKNGEILVMNGLTDKNELGMARSYSFVNPEVKGKGYGSISLALKSWVAFYIWDIRKQWTYIDEDNTASRKLYEKIGFFKEGILRGEGFRNNTFFDMTYYGLFKDEFNLEFYNSIKELCDNQVAKGFLE